jgi:transcriptional regulator with XRE-family HTH domain
VTTIARMVDDSGAGQRIKQRREKYGMTKSDLAARSGVSRGRLAEIEAGIVPGLPETIVKIEAALDKFQQETSGPYDEPGGMVTYRLTGNFGVDVTLQGPVSNLSELEQAVARLLAQMQQQPPGQN